MKMTLLNYLRCPDCGGKFECRRFREADGEVIEGELKCPNCSVIHPIKRGIPRFLPVGVSKKTLEGAERFGWEWRKFSLTVEAGYLGSKELFLDFIVPVEESFFSSKVILDAGCGLGRFTSLAHQFGAFQVIGIDLGSSVELAYEKTRNLPGVHILQADLHRLPFGEIFDYIFSIGVLHHLLDPEKGFRSLVKHMKEGAGISIYVYGREDNDLVIRLIDPVRKYVTSRLPKPILYIISHLVTLALFFALKRVYNPFSRFSCHFPFFKKLLTHREYLSFISSFTYSELQLVVFDQLTPRITNYIKKDEITSWFEHSGLQEVRVTCRLKNGWCGFGKML